MSSDSTTKLDISPLTVIVSEGLDPRVRRQMEAEQQADVKTYAEMTRDMEVQHDLNKIRKEVDDKGEESDPFKEPDSVEEKAKQEPTPTPATAPAPAAPAPAAAPAEDNKPAATAEPAAAPAGGEQTPAPAASTAGATGGGDAEDLESAFESHGTQLPKDLLLRVAKDYIKMESGDHDIGSLDHIKTFVYVDLGQNNVKGDTLESVQTIRDPENTIVLIMEETSPDADTTLRARKVAEMLTSRGVKVFYAMDDAIDYLNNLFDVVSGRTKGSE